MLKKSTGTIAVLLLQAIGLYSQKVKSFTLSSPDGRVTITITVGKNLQWQVKHGSDNVIIPSAINLKLQSGEVLGENVTIASTKKQTVNKTINAVVDTLHRKTRRILVKQFHPAIQRTVFGFGRNKSPFILR